MQCYHAHNRSALESSLYEATRYALKISIEKAKRAEIVAAVRFGIIVDVFVPSDWLPATVENFPGRTAVPGRVGFVWLANAFQRSTENKVHRIRSSIRTNDRLVLTLTPVI